MGKCIGDVLMVLRVRVVMQVILVVLVVEVVVIAIVVLIITIMMTVMIMPPPETTFEKNTAVIQAGEAIHGILFRGL